MLTRRANISFAFRGVQTSLPPNLRGWDTGTLEINHASFEVNADSTSDFEVKPCRLRVVTNEKTEVMQKKEATVSGNTITWDLEQVRLPIYHRYQGSVVFDIGKNSSALSAIGIKDAAPDAIAVLWLQDLTDDLEQEVKLPVISGENLENLRQNAINDQTAKHHNFKVIGFLTTRLKLDSGLDEDHEVSLLSYSWNHELMLETPIESITTTCS